jgi:hypothetical protein
MGKMKIGSSGSYIDETVSEPVTITSERIVERIIEIPKPVTKDVIVEIPKPVYKVVEVDEVIQKPRITVEEVPQVVIKPIFSIKQETIVLDQLQRKLDESVSLASSKLATLNSQVAQQSIDNTELKNEVSELKQELLLLKKHTLICIIVVGVITTLASLLG